MNKKPVLSGQIKICILFSSCGGKKDTYFIISGILEAHELENISF
jgi:hypothetical protein